MLVIYRSRTTILEFVRITREKKLFLWQFAHTRTRTRFRVVIKAPCLSSAGTYRPEFGWEKMEIRLPVEASRFRQRMDELQTTLELGARSEEITATAVVISRPSNSIRQCRIFRCALPTHRA